MSNFFSTDSGLYKFMSRLWDMLILNAMWFICSLPIVTIGASTTAAFSITLKMVDDQEGYMAGPFWKAFKSNLKKGSIVGILQLVAMYALYLDFQIANAVQQNGKNSLVFYIIGVVGVVLLITHFIYAYALLARYENSIINTLRNSHSISIKYILKTIFLLGVLFVEVYLFYFIGIGTPTLMFFGLLFGPACIILTISGFARQFFYNIERENDIREEEEKISKAEQRGKSFSSKEDE